MEVIDIKISLIAINTKYGHTNPAVRLLREYCRELPAEISVLEFTINNTDIILRNIYEEKPDIIGFSCYIWNINYVVLLCSSLRKLMPDVFILAGGPEVSFEYDSFLRSGVFDAIAVGEGEQSFKQIVISFLQDSNQTLPINIKLAEIPGIAYMESKSIRTNPIFTPELDLTLSYTRDELLKLRDRIIYYEASRGCPYKCAYCLSGSQTSASVRFRSIDMVLEDLKLFLDSGMQLVKFVDRTFNCRTEFARAIWSFLIDNDNNETVFHFEIAAELLDDADIELLSTARPGYFQFEAGIQTINSTVLESVNRKSNISKIAQNIERLNQKPNIRLHLDLIAGLPGEDITSFRESLEFAFMLHPNRLQLGFLKLIKGSILRSEAEKLGILYREHPPYEVLCTSKMSYDDLSMLKLVSEAIDIYHNSHMFRHSIRYLTRNGMWEVFMALAELLSKAGIGNRSLSKAELFEIIAGYCRDDALALCLLKFDMILNDKVCNEPLWFPDKMDGAELQLGRKYIQALRNKSLKVNKSLQINKFSFDIPAFISGGYADAHKCTVYVLFEYGFDKRNEACVYSPVNLR